MKRQNDYPEIAAAWRQSNAEQNPAYLNSGVVLIWQEEAYGWKNVLRDPAHEQPGVIAVDELGRVFRAEGGNEYDGAKAWVASN